MPAREDRVSDRARDLALRVGGLLAQRGRALEAGERQEREHDAEPERAALPTPAGSEKTSLEMSPWPGAVPPISLAKMTTISTMMSVTEIASIESSARVVTLMSP